MDSKNCSRVNICLKQKFTLAPYFGARGMTEIAHASGIGREALYKALRPNAQPRFDTIARVCVALGLKISVQVA